MIPRLRVLTLTTTVLLLGVATALPGPTDDADLQAGGAVCTHVDPGTVSGDAGCALWNVNYAAGPGGPAGRATGNDVVVSPDGAIVYGIGRAGHASADVAAGAVVARDGATGQVVWEAFAAGSLGYSASFAAGAVSPDGDVVVAVGTAIVEKHASYTQTDLLAVGFDAATGATLWTTTYNGPRSASYVPEADDTGTDVAFSPDGQTIAVLGATERQFGLADIGEVVVMALDSDGTTRWVERIDGGDGGKDRASAVGVTPDGQHVIVAGSVDEPWGDNAEDWLVAALDVDTGSEVWRTILDSYNNGQDADGTKDLAIGPDGTVYVTGHFMYTTSAAGGYYVSRNIGLAALDGATGAVQWRTEWTTDGDNDDFGNGIALSPDGTRVVVTGTTFAGGLRGVTLAYDAWAGDLQWATLTEPAPTQWFWTVLAKPAFSPDGGTVYGVGTASTWAPTDTFVAAWDAATGEQQWAARYDRGAASYDNTQAIGVNPVTGDVYTVGAGGSIAEPSAWLNLAYPASGPRLTAAVGVTA